MSVCNVRGIDRHTIMSRLRKSCQLTYLDLDIDEVPCIPSWVVISKHKELYPKGSSLLGTGCSRRSEALDAE